MPEGLPVMSGVRARTRRAPASLPQGVHTRRLFQREVIQTPTIVTASPTNIAGVSGSENISHAQIMVTGGLR